MGNLKTLEAEGTASLQVRVFEEIERAILSGEFESGENLAELRLSTELGVSRTPVREALRQLELEGLVKIIPNKGAVVVGVTEKDIEDIYVIRMRMEDLAVRWAAELMTDEDAKTLQDIVELQEFYLQKGDVEKLCETDSAFHEAIYRFSRSKPLNQMLTGFHHYIRHARAVSFKASGRAPTSVEEHRAIAQAFFYRDAEQAARLMVEHIGKAKENLLKTLKQEKA